TLQFILSLLFSFVHHRHLPSFPTRRSSDLIGVIPAVLLILMAFILYGFGGQFANFVVTSELNTRLQSLASGVQLGCNHEVGKLSAKPIEDECHQYQQYSRNDSDEIGRASCRERR